MVDIHEDARNTRDTSEINIITIAINIGKVVVTCEVLAPRSEEKLLMLPRLWEQNPMSFRPPKMLVMLLCLLDEMMKPFLITGEMEDITPVVREIGDVTLIVGGVHDVPSIKGDVMMSPSSYP